MASYFQGGIDFVPPGTPFTPNYNLILSTLQYKQNQYDVGFEQLKSTRSLLDSPMLTNVAKGRRDQILANAEQSLKNLSQVDLSLSQNVAAAKSVFQPFFEDDLIAHDMAQTKSWSAEIQRGRNLCNSDKDEDRKRCWTTGLEYLNNWAEDFSKMDEQTALRTRAPKYVGKPQVGQQVLDLFKDGKLKMSTDYLTGQAIVTDENGRQMKDPLTNLFISMAQMDPEAMEGYRIYGDVERRRFIRDGVKTGLYANEVEAAKGVDAKIVADFRSILGKQINSTDKAITELSKGVESFKDKLGKGLIADQNEFEKGSQKVAELERLKARLTNLRETDKNAESNILSNVPGRLGQIYLHKTAQDLAEALSNFSSRKIAANPLIKDLQLPFDLAQFNSDLNIREQNNQAELNERAIRLRAELGVGNEGDGSTGSGGGAGKVTRSSLDQGFVETSVAASGVDGDRDAKDQANAYQQNLEQKRTIVKDYSNTKLNLIEELIPDQMLNSNGQRMTPLEKANLLTTDGATLDKLYNQALQVYNQLEQANNPADVARLSRAREMKTKADKLQLAWQGADEFMQEKLKQVTDFLADSRDAPERQVTETQMASNVTPSKTVTKTVKGENDGFAIRALVHSNGALVADDDAGKATYMANLRKSKGFTDEVEKMIDTYVKTASSWQGSRSTVAINREDYRPQATDEVSKKYEKKFSTYRDMVVTTWNDPKTSFNFMSGEDPRLGMGGGGTTGKVLTFTGSKDVQGEQADVLTLNLLGQLGEFEGNNEKMVVAAGQNTPKNGPPSQSDNLRNLLFNTLKGEMLRSIKVGKSGTLSDYNIKYSPVAGNDPSWHAYTFEFSSEYLTKLMETDGKPGLLTKDQVNALKSGLSIYIKKDADNSLFAQRASLGEIDYLINLPKSKGTVRQDIGDGYSVELIKQARGNYSVVINGKKFNAKTKQIEPMTPVVRNVDPGTDLTYYFYRTINELHNLIDLNQSTYHSVQEQERKKPGVKTYTMDDLNEAVKRMSGN